jgi:hypothetical protein
MNQPKIVIQIAISEDNKVYVMAPKDKKLVYNLLAEAIRIITATPDEKPLIEVAQSIPPLKTN